MTTKHANNNTIIKPEIDELSGMFQAIADTAEIGILVIDKHNRVEYVNKMATQITGLAAEKLAGSNFINFLDEKNREIFKGLQGESTLSQNAKKPSGEIELETPLGPPVILETSFIHYPGEDPENGKYFVCLRDISIHKRLLDELQDSEKKYRELFEQMDQGICLSTKEGHILDCNPALLKILGYDSKEEFMKINISKDMYADPEDRKEFQRRIEKDGHIINFEVAFKKKNKEIFPIMMNSHAQKNEKGEIVGYQGLIIDISERIRIESELREKHGFLSNLIESSVDCIVVSDMSGTVLFFNNAAEKLTGYRAADVIGKFHISNFYSLETAKDIMKKLRGHDFGGRGKLENFRLTIFGKNKEEIPVSLSASIVYEGDKEIASLGVFTDLREKIKIEKELKEAQLRLLQSEKMASLGGLAAGVAHEVNNPLGGILIYASLLMEEFEADNDARVSDLQRIVEEAKRCKEIVKSLLEFGRQTESRYESVDINKAIIDGLFFLENQALFHNITIEKHLDFSNPEINGNPNQLKQVFMNMLVNAGEAMSEEGGTLTITTGVSTDNSSVIISFQDTGYGISPEIQSKIFDPFFTTKEVGKGTGLGLSTSYGIIQSHHGNIDVESEVGKGTVFTILLPVMTEKE